jgi:hypothetical protein
MGHLAVMEKLSYDKKKPIGRDNHPKLYFVRETTRECWSQMNKYIWDDWRGVNKDNRSKKEVPKDINKDMPDCVRYLIMSNPMWFNPFDSGEPEEKQVSFHA